MFDVFFAGALLLGLGRSLRARLGFGSAAALLAVYAFAADVLSALQAARQEAAGGVTHHVGSAFGGLLLGPTASDARTDGPLPLGWLEGRPSIVRMACIGFSLLGLVDVLRIVAQANPERSEVAPHRAAGNAFVLAAVLGAAWLLMVNLPGWISE